MTYLILAVLGITLVIVLWLSTQLVRVRAKLAVIPEDNDVLALFCVAWTMISPESTIRSRHWHPASPRSRRCCPPG